jgi:hypothetical protein
MNGVCCMAQEFLTLSFHSPLLSVDPCLGLYLNYATVTVGDILIVPVTVRQTSFCNLLCSILKSQNTPHYADSVSNNFLMNIFNFPQSCLERIINNQ